MDRKQMVKRVVTTSLDRARSDPIFLQQLLGERKLALKEVLHQVATSEPDEPITMADEQEVLNQASQTIDLVPFLKREEVTKMVKDIIEHTAAAFTSTLTLTQVLFWVGIAFCIATFGLEAYGMIAKIPLEASIPGGILGGGLGFGFIYNSFVRRPLAAMQNSVGNLAQIQMVFLAFLDQLSVLMAHGGSGSVEDITAIVHQIDEAVEKSVARIETYCEYREAPGTK